MRNEKCMKYVYLLIAVNQFQHFSKLGGPYFFVFVLFFYWQTILTRFQKVNFNIFDQYQAYANIRRTKSIIIKGEKIVMEKCEHKFKIYKNSKKVCNWKLRTNDSPKHCVASWKIQMALKNIKLKLMSVIYL